MCGIAGIWRRNAPVEREELQAFCSALRHRGPDGEGIWLHPSGRVGFAHRRLAIVDLSPAAAQPMESPSGRTCIVYNGEIYNFHELRHQAAARGWCFRSQSDTEVILALYEQRGIAALEALRGMFAFALWDEGEQRLWLVRDRMGIKPLYYYWDGACFAFGSELGVFRWLRGFDARLDISAVWDFLSYHYVPPPKSVYARVRKLEAGSWLCLEAATGTLRQHRYWRVPDPREEALDVHRAESELEALLAEVVAEHLVADVPVGAFLSGGVDSSLVVAYARRRQPVWVFTADFDVATKSERAYAEAVARQFRLPQRIVRLTAEDFFPAVEQFVRTYGEPFGDASGIGVLALARRAREEVKAVLSGDGGDELFAGYIRDAADFRGRRISIRSARVVPWLLRKLPTLRGQRWLRTLLSAQGYVLHVPIWMVDGQKRRIIAPELVAALPPEYDELWFLRQFLREGVSPLRQRLLLDMQTWLPEKMLPKVDRASMSVGLEVRVPLVDHRLVEWVCRVPEHLLWQPQRGGKWLLKRLLERELPAELVYRPKKGFSVPLQQWMQRSRWSERVRASRFWLEGVFHRELFRRADLRSPVTQFLVLVLAVWSDENPWLL